MRTGEKSAGDLRRGGKGYSIASSSNSENPRDGKEKKRASEETRAVLSWKNCLFTGRRVKSHDFVNLTGRALPYLGKEERTYGTLRKKIRRGSNVRSGAAQALARGSP